MMVNTMKQQENKTTSYRGEEKLSQLVLVFTEPQKVDVRINYQSPMGKGNHVIMDIEQLEEKYYKEGRDTGMQDGTMLMQTLLSFEIFRKK